jgi:hypothetical protein
MDLDAFDPERFRIQLLHDFKESLQEVWDDSPGIKHRNSRQSLSDFGHSSGSASFSELLQQLESAHLQLVAQLRDQISELEQSASVAPHVFSDQSYTINKQPVSTVVNIDEDNSGLILDERQVLPALPAGYKGEPAIVKEVKKEFSTVQFDDRPSQELAVEKASKQMNGTEELALKVTAVSARGLRKADGGTHELSASVCECHIKGQEGSGFRTRAIKKSHDPEWAHDEVLPDYVFGDDLTFTVFEQNVGKTDLLGTADLESSEFTLEGFEGELELIDAKGHGNAYLQVKIATAPKGPDVLVLPVCQKKKTHRGSARHRASTAPTAGAGRQSAHHAAGARTARC